LGFFKTVVLTKRAIDPTNMNRWLPLVLRVFVAAHRERKASSAGGTIC